MIITGSFTWDQKKLMHSEEHCWPFEVWSKTELLRHVEQKICYTRIRKNARYGKTSHGNATQIGLSFQISFSTPENTKTFKDLIKIDRVRLKIVKTRFERAHTEGACAVDNWCWRHFVVFQESLRSPICKHWMGPEGPFSACQACLRSTWPDSLPFIKLWMSPQGQLKTFCSFSNPDWWLNREPKKDLY